MRAAIVREMHLRHSLAVNPPAQNELNRLLSLAASVARLRARSAYRLSATAAYGRIVSERLDWLDPQPLPGVQTLGEFTNRRILPALRTCENFSVRLEALALEIEQATGLSRAWIKTGPGVQNADLLRGLDATAKRQLRLQHLVEGLSVIALILTFLLWQKRRSH